MPLDIFTNGKIAKQYKMGRMKSTCIINEALASHFLQETVSSRRIMSFLSPRIVQSDTSLEKKNLLTMRILVNANQPQLKMYLKMMYFKTFSTETRSLYIMFFILLNVLVSTFLPLCEMNWMNSFWNTSC